MYLNFSNGFFTIFNSVFLSHIIILNFFQIYCGILDLSSSGLLSIAIPKWTSSLGQNGDTYGDRIVSVRHNR